MMRPKDRYRSFADLCQSKREHIDFRIMIDERVSPLVIVAPHGGSIERGTSPIARALAGDDYSLYRFVGIKRKRSADLHLTSTTFDEPACVRLLPGYEWVVTVHGCSGAGEIVYVGGLEEGLKAALTGALNAAGFRAEIVLNQNGLAGRDPRNLCNRGKAGRGVQLELDSALRRTMFARATGPRRGQRTQVFYRFSETVRAVLRTWVERGQLGD